jgi:hypothetical protein
MVVNKNETRYDSMRKQLLLAGMMTILCVTTACGKGTDNKSTTVEEVTEQVTEDTETSEITEENSNTEFDNNSLTESTSEVENAGDTADNQATSEAASSENNTDMYAVCTSLSKTEVETFATTVKKQILDKDWAGLSENISYPITVEGVTYEDSNAFSTGDFSNLYSDDFVKALEDESCTDMFCNYQGIMLGNGQVWISEVLDAAGNSEGLKVITLQSGE